MTKEQQLAIKRMNRALKELGRVGITICGMDNSLLYATDEAIDRDGEGRYCEVANAVEARGEGVGSFDADCYEDSGGY